MQGSVPMSTWDARIVKGVPARDQVHLFLLVPPRRAIFNVMRMIKGRSSQDPQRELPEHRWRFSTNAGNVTDDIILPYQALHMQHKPVGTSR